MIDLREEKSFFFSMYRVERFSQNNNIDRKRPETRHAITNDG